MTHLATIPVEAMDNPEEQYKALEALRDSIEVQMHNLLNNTDIADLDITISASPTQSEVQQTADKVDAILALLRTATIMGE